MRLLAQNFDAIQSQVPGYNLPATLGGIISKFLPYVFYSAGIILLIYMVTAGLQMMTSRGDPKVMQMAQAKITHGLIGFVVIIFSVTIVLLFGKVFGITIFENIFGSGGRITNP